jgi:hypothetical protein
MRLVARRLINDGDNMIVNSYSSGARSYVEADTIESNAASASAVYAANTDLDLRCRRIEFGAGGGILALGNAAANRVTLDVEEIESGGGNALGLGSGAGGTCVVTGRVGSFVETSASTAIDISFSAGSEAHLVVGKIDCTTAYDIAASTVLRLLVGELSGTETIAAGADVRVTKAMRNDYGATGAPTGAYDDSAGFTEGSVVVNTGADDAYMCVDASAPVWKQITREAPTGAISDMSGTGSTGEDGEARIAINDILAALRYHGLINT